MSASLPSRGSSLPIPTPDVMVHYNCENGLWWGAVQGWRWSCSGKTLEDCRQLALEGIPFCVDERLRASSVMFMQVTHSDSIFVTPTASETFRLYVPDERDGHA